MGKVPPSLHSFQVLRMAKRKPDCRGAPQIKENKAELPSQKIIQSKSELVGRGPGEEGGVSQSGEGLSTSHDSIKGSTHLRRAWKWE